VNIRPDRVGAWLLILASCVHPTFSQEASSVTTGFAPVADGQLYYETSGRGAPLVLIHGNAGDRRHWDQQFAALSGSFTVIRYDVRGFGRSSLPTEGRSYANHDVGKRFVLRAGASPSSRTATFVRALPGCDIKSKATS
jgi:pimeloyl-ACP methyl ester carboxylesterase